MKSKRSRSAAKRRSAKKAPARRAAVRRPAVKRAAASRPAIRLRPASSEAPIVLKPLFNKNALKIFRQLLLTQKANLAGGIKQIAKEAARSQRDAAGDLSTYTYHMADVASDTYDREFSMNIASSEQKVLYQIEEALKRVDDGSYGRCLDCTKPIPQTRLRAVSYAALCIACQRQREDRRHR